MQQEIAQHQSLLFVESIPLCMQHPICGRSVMSATPQIYKNPESTIQSQLI